MIAIAKKTLFLAALGIVGFTGLITALITVNITGNSDTGEKTAKPEEADTEIVRTVEWYRSHHEEMNAVFKECADNPGELAQTPNCVNVKQAMLLNSSGKLPDLGNWGKKR